MKTTAPHDFQRYLEMREIGRYHMLDLKQRENVDKMLERVKQHIDTNYEKTVFWMIATMREIDKCLSEAKT